MNQCLPLLRDQLLSCLAELMKDGAREKEEHQTAVAKLQGFEGQEITGKGLSQGRRGSNAGLPRVASQTAAEPEETPEEGEEDLAPGDGPIDLAALEAKRDEARRLRAQAEEADEIFKVYDDMDEIERLLEEIEKAKAEAKAAEAQQGEPEPVPPTSPRRNSHVRSFIKAEGRKKKKLLQQRNIKFKMLQKLLQQANAQAAASGGATYVPTAPETTEERAERIQKNLDVVQDRTRRLSQQLEFWDNRIDRRKNAMETEKKNLRKEEQNLEHPRDEEASGLSESSQDDTPEADPLDIDLTQESLAGGANDLLSNKKGHVIAKKYSRMMRPTVFRKSKVSATEEEDLKPERMPLALFGGQAGSHTEGAAHDGGRRSSGHLTVEHPKSRTPDTPGTEVDLADGPGAAFDQLVRKLSRRENSSFLEGIQKLRPSARHYTRGTRREGPGQKKRSKRRISIQSFVDKLSDQAPDSRRPSAEEELDLPQQGSRRLTQPPEGPGRSTSRVSNASIESRPFSDRDGGDIQRIVQQAMRKMEESNEAQQGDPGEMHLETVRLLRRAAQMTAKNQVSEDVLSSANFLQAHQMDLLSVQGQQKAVPSQRSVYKVDDSPMVGSNQVLAWADRRPGRAITARARYALTKAQLLALDAMPSAPSRSPSKKDRTRTERPNRLGRMEEALRRLYRAGTSPLRDTSLRSLKGSRSLSRSRSKLSRQDKPEAARAKRADAHKEIMRLKVMALHHSAQRRRLLQHQQAMSSDEEEEAQAKSIMELAEASQKTSDFRGGGVDRMPSKVTNTKSGQGPIFNEEMPDERVSEVAAKWRGERSDTEPSLMVDAALSEAEVAKPLAHNAFRPFRSRSRARRIARPRPARPPEQGEPPEPTSTAVPESSSSSSSSDEDYHGSSPSRHGDGSERSREENVHFRNVSYFIDLMNEIGAEIPQAILYAPHMTRNDSRRRRSNKKNSRRRRKALEHQQKPLGRNTRSKVHHRHLGLARSRGPEVMGAERRPEGLQTGHAMRQKLAAPRTRCDVESAAEGARETAAVGAVRGRTPRRREHRELHTEEHQVVPVATSEVHLNLGPEKPSSEVKQEVPLSPKNVKVKLEEGGWTRLPQIAPERDGGWIAEKAQVEEARYKLSDKASLAAFLQDADIRLIRAPYLFHLRRHNIPLPRRQEAEGEVCEKDSVQMSALVTHSEVRKWAAGSKDAIICSVSHAWETREHPDPCCFQLGHLVDTISLYEAAYYSEIWVFYDYTSLYQFERETDAQRESFARAMGNMHVMYAHDCSLTLRIEGLTPPHIWNAMLKDESRKVPVYHMPSGSLQALPLKELMHNRTPYLQRGWCLAEVQWSAVRGTTAQNQCIYGFYDESSSGQVPLTPEAFAEQMRTSAFTHRNDAETVVELQKKVFFERVTYCKEVFFENLLEEDLEKLVLRHNCTLKKITLGFNGIETEGCKALLAGLRRNKIITEINIRYEIDADPEVLVKVEKIVAANQAGVVQNAFKRFRNVFFKAFGVFMWLHFVHHLTLHFEARTAETENDGPKKASAETENDGPKKASAFPSEPRIKVLAEPIVLVQLRSCWCVAARRTTEALAAMLRENRSVETVDLDYKGIGELGCQALLEALRQNSRVWEMELRRNPEISDEAWIS
eukprot:g13132.t1